MPGKKMRIDLDKLFDDMEHTSEQEIKKALAIAELIYNSLDIPFVLVNSETIKSNTLLIAMYCVGKEFGKAEQLEKQITEQQAAGG